MDIKEIKEQYPSLKMWEDNRARELYKLIQEHQLITEFLYTVDPLKTSLQISKQLGHDVVYVNYVKKGDKISKMELTFRDKLELNIKQVNDLMEKFGWYPSFIDTKNGGKYSTHLSKFIGFKNITIIYEAKYDQEVKLINQYIYHLTPDIKWSKIKYMGLTPKSQGKIADHPERIYFMENINNLEDRGGDMNDIAFALLDKYPHKDKVKEMYLLKIDTDKLKNITFFEDSSFFMGNAIWTYQNIPPFAISIEQKIDITN